VEGDRNLLGPAFDVWVVDYSLRAFTPLLREFKPCIMLMQNPENILWFLRPRHFGFPSFAFCALLDASLFSRLAAAAA